MVKKLCLIWVGLLLFFSSFSQSQEWKLDKDENGIKVYTRPVEGFPVDELRTETVVQASMAAVVAVIMDADNYEEWVFACSESHIVEKISESEQYQYQVNDLPYPISDRDLVIHFTAWQDPATKIVYTTSIGEPGYLKNVDGKVRIPTFIAGYTLTPLEDGRIDISYQLKLDPGGSIPDWMVNLFIVKGPYESTLKMVERLKRGLYDNASFNFLKPQ